MFLGRSSGKSSGTSQPVDRSMPAGVPASAAAPRVHRRWWRDSRVITGVIVVVVCMLAGARIVTWGEDRVSVWQVTRDLSAGANLSPSEVSAVEIPDGLTQEFLSAGAVPEGRLTRDVRAGELLTVSALAAGGDPNVRWVTLPIAPLHAPADLASGDRVDIWSTPRADLGAATIPELVLMDVLIAQIFSDARGFEGDYAVVVEVLPEQTAEVLRASRGGAIDLVRVPLRVVRAES
jgi:hypothetical protein